jgi:hypothetical protein
VTHLGEKATALVDGQLSLEATERAYAHLAHCRDCRDKVEAERLMKSRLFRLPSPALGTDLMGRLLALGGPSGPLPPRSGHVPGSPRPVPVPINVQSSRAAVDPGAGGDAAGAGMGFVSDAGSVLVTPTIGSALVVGVTLARGPGSPTGPGRPVSRSTWGRSVVHRPVADRPAGRPPHPPQRTSGRARFAVAVLGALGVVGAGVGGLVLVGSGTASGGSPSQARLDSFIVQRSHETRATVPAGASLELPTGSQQFGPEGAAGGGR